MFLLHVSNYGRFHATKKSVRNFGNSSCPMERTFQLNRPNPSHRSFGYCYCKQDTKERYWGQQFSFVKSVRPTEITGPVKVDHLQSCSRILGWEQTEMVRSNWCSSGNVRNFGLNGKRSILQCTTAHIPMGHFLAIFTNWRAQTSTNRDSVRVCLHGGGGPQESEVTRLSI